LKLGLKDYKKIVILYSQKPINYMKTRIVLFVVMLIMLPALSQAQIGGMLRKATSKVAGSIGKAATKEAVNEIDSAALKNAEQTGNNQADNSNQSNQENSGGKGMNLGGLFSGGPVTSKYNENYSFNSRMYMVMEMYEKKEVTKMDYYMYFSASIPNAGMEVRTVAKPDDGDAVPVTAQMILDGENKSFMMLTDMGSMKVGVISPLPEQNAGVTDPATGQPVKPPVVTKTGNSRVIAGFKCDEFLFREADEKETSKVWMTKDQVFNVDKRFWSKTNMGTLYSYPGFEGMTALAWESYDEKNVLIAKSETIEINKDFPHTMTTKGFSFRQMDFNKMMQNQNQNQKK
jgi:hypothetical protein